MAPVAPWMSRPAGKVRPIAALTPFFDEQIEAMRRTLREAGVASSR